MNHAAVASVLAAWLVGPFAIAPPQTFPGTAANTERIESGELPSPGGDLLTWRIRLLPLSAYPDLPSGVAAQLSRRQCMVPQSFEAKQPENVIRGAFRAPGSDDWAALCSTAGDTTLYVFFAGQYDAPMQLRTQPDTAWLAAEPGSSVFSSAWGIALRRSAELRASPLIRRTANPDHDAIEDARLERSTTLHYYQAGKWLLLDAGD